MENRLESQITASQFREDEADPLNQILSRAYHTIVQTLVGNLRKVTRKNFSEERGTLGIVYRRFTTELDVSSRDMVLDAVSESIRMSNLTPESLLPFVENDSSPMIVTKAVRYYLENADSPLNNPLRGVGDLLELMNNPRNQNTGVILAGLVAFGDRRVCAAIRPHQDRLTIETMRQFAISIQDNHLHRPSIVHCLSWLYELLKQGKSKPEIKEHATLVAAAITRMVLHANGQVEDRQFHFGCHGFKSYSKSISVTYSEFLREIEPMLALLSEFDHAGTEKMIALFQEPAQLPTGADRRNSDGRRKASERRGTADRRVINIAPVIERRRENRRNLQRRQAIRR